MQCPRACKACTSARYVVACPLPHDEVMARPKMTIFMAWLSGGGLGPLAPQDGGDLPGAAGVIVVAERTLPHGLSDGACFIAAHRPQPAHHVFRATGDQDLAFRLEKCLH